MLICSSCQENKKFNEGQICCQCSQLFCDNHQLQNCPYCGSIFFKKISIQEERINELIIEWVVIDDKSAIGITDNVFLPTYFTKLWSILGYNSKTKVILFPNKQQSITYEKSMKWDEFHNTKRVISEKSRYSIISLKDGSRLILFNQSSLTEQSAIFLLSFLEKMLNAVAENRAEFSQNDEKPLFEAMIKAVYLYNQKMGIPFISERSFIKEIIPNLLVNVSAEFLEIKTLQSFLKEKGTIKSIADFINYRTDLAFMSMDYSARFNILEVFQNVEKSLLLNLVLSSISNNGSLENYVENYYQREFEKFKQKYNTDLPDLIRAFNLIHSRRNNLDISSYAGYIQTISELLISAYDELEPKYVSPAEIADLLVLSDNYLDSLMCHQSFVYPNIGTIYGYTDLLRKILNVNDTYPEIRIMAGFALEETLMHWAMIDNNRSIFYQYVDCVKKVASLIVNFLPEVIKKNGPYGNYKGSILSYDDAAQKLLTASKLANSFKDYNLEAELLALGEDISLKYDLPAVLLGIWWHSFVDSQNFDFLEKIYNRLQNIDTEKVYQINFLAPTLVLLSESLLYKRNIDEKIDLAEVYLLQAMPNKEPLKLTDLFTIRTTQGFQFILEMFRYLLKSEIDFKNIKQAYNCALFMEQEFLPVDPLLILSKKTKLLFFTVNEEFEKAEFLIKELHGYPDRERFIARFLNMINSWIELSRTSKRRYIYRTEFSFNSKDIWVSILQRHINKVMDSDLGLNIAGSRAIVFVEGMTDVLVFNEFKEKISSPLRIQFFNVEGYSNNEYYVDSRFFKELKIPAYIIFDGDTKEEKRKSTLDLMRIKIPIDHIYALREKSIENYLICISALTRAYPNLDRAAVTMFFERTKLKKNKKYVLELFFREFNIGAYNKETAKYIASNFDLAEIPSEIIQLLEKITELKILRN